MLAYRADVPMVFQDPFSSINPVFRISHGVLRSLKLHRPELSAARADRGGQAGVGIVGLSPATDIMSRYPHELSGGQRQRVGFAQALAMRRKPFLADEPVSMLDVSIRIGLLNLMKQLRDEQGVSILYITHDIASARFRPVDSVSLYQFSTDVSQLVPYTSDEARLDDALGHLHPGAATALYDAIYLSAISLQRRKGRRIIVLITDGGDTASKTDYPEALRAAQIAEAIIYPIIMVPIEADAGRDTGGEHALIQLSLDTGGKFYYASSLAQLDEAFRQISGELRTQYLLAYYPANRVGGDFRRITVELTAQAKQRAQRELVVRHRAGYYNSKIE